MSTEGTSAMSAENKSVLVPRLRFPEFREAGEWVKPKLGSLGTFTGGGTPSTDNASYWEGSNPWVSSSDISEDSIHGIKINRFISDKAILETATKVVPANSILLVSRVGVGKLAITKENICTSQDFTSFTPASDNLVFMAYSLKVLKEVFLSFNQGMAIKGFTKEDASNVEIPLPGKPEEQQKIADCLSSLDELITAETQKLDALKTHKKGLMQQLFPCEGETVPRLRFLEFRGSGEWVAYSLGGFIEEYREKSSTQDEHEVLTSARSGLIRQRDYYDNDRITERDNVGFNVIPPNYLTYRSRSDDRRFYFNENNLGITGIISTYYPVFRINEGSNKFFIELLSHHAELVGKHSVGTSQTVLSLNELRRIKLPIPKEPEQQRIADCLNSLDDLITAQSQRVDDFKTHKKGLMQQLFPVQEEVLT